MPVAIEWQETQSIVRLEGDLGLNSAAELKGILLDCLASGKALVLDLERAGEIDVSILQLLWAAGREAAREGTGIASRVSDVAAGTVRDAGFEPFLGAVQG